jgi:hypothetical protein
MARHRRHWNAEVAKVIFSAALVLVAVFLSLSTVPHGTVNAETPELYRRLSEQLPANARVMINDPAQLYYFTGLGGVTLPNEAPEVILDIARHYDVDYLVLEGITENGGAAAPRKLLSILQTPPDFLAPLSLNVADVQLYEIRR